MKRSKVWLSCKPIHRRWASAQTALTLGADTERSKVLLHSLARIIMLREQCVPLRQLQRHRVGGNQAAAERVKVRLCAMEVMESITPAMAMLGKSSDVT